VSATGDHAWARFMSWWHAAFFATVVFTVVWAALDIGISGRFLVAGGLYVLLAAWYLAAPDGLFRAQAVPASRRWSASRVYLAGALLLFTVADFVYPGSGFLLFILVPQCFLLLELRPAITAAIGLTVVSTAAQLAVDGVSRGAVATIALFGVLSLAFSILIGTYMDKIIRQSQQRADLIDELNQTRADLARVSRDAGVLAERERLAGEIHDTLAQNFTSILMLMQAAQAGLDRDLGVVRRQIDLAEATARNGLAEARSLVAALSPVPLQSSALTEALPRVVDDFAARSQVATGFEVVGAIGALPANVEIVLLRAAQEALTNIGRHAGATKAQVTLRYHADGCQLEVCDNGRGVDRSAGEGYGLRGMRARVAQVDGRLEVGAAPAGGAMVRVTIPVAPSCQTGEAVGAIAPHENQAEARPPNGAAR